MGRVQIWVGTRRNSFGRKLLRWCILGFSFDNEHMGFVIIFLPHQELISEIAKDTDYFGDN